MKVLSDVHQQFAAFFPSKNLQPYLYLLSKKLSDGHICIDPAHIDEKDLLEMPEGYIPKKFPDNDPLVSGPDGYKPLILHHGLLYLHRYFTYETTILNKIKELIHHEKENDRNYSDLLIKTEPVWKVLFGSEVKLNEVSWQWVAAISAVLNNFTIITGGPGTGKTTTVAKILTVLYSVYPDLRVALAAPTGKAAARMGDSLRQAATNARTGQAEEVAKGFESIVPATIHRLLGYVPKSIYFKHDENNPLNYDVVIIDESSMIDVAMFSKLLQAIKPSSKVILLGDKDQLASVEAGSLFGDLCQAQKKMNLFPEERVRMINNMMGDRASVLPKIHISKERHPLEGHVIELQQSHRFSDKEGIGKFSKAIIQDQQEMIRSFFKNEDNQIQIDSGYTDQVFQDFIVGYHSYIKEKDILESLKKLNRLKVLCVTREGEYGLYSMNKKIEQYLAKQNFLQITGEFYINRPVMMISNNYELNLFNGDIGLVREDGNGELKVWFDNNGELASFAPSYISNAETVFAMTIHKSQGSEFDQVMVILPDMAEVPLLTRELLYTAVTRARSKVIVQGKESAILKAAGSFVKRGSGIIQRFNFEPF